MKVKFSKNEKKILSLLAEATIFKNVTNLSEEVKISERSIYKNLTSMNKKLEVLGIEGTRNIYGHGYYLSQDSKNAIKNRILYDHEKNGANYDVLDRKYLEYLKLFLNGKFSIQEMMRESKVSKQTILKDISALSKDIKPFGLKIEATQEGHILKGPEIQIRHFLFNLLFSDSKLVDLYSSKEIRELKSLIDRWISSFESSNDIIYSDEFIFTFDIFYALVLERVFNGKSKSEKKQISNKISLTAEYRAASSFLPILLGDKFDSFETYYLTTIMLGGQKRQVSENSISQDIDQIAENLIHNFKNLADCEFKNEEQLYKDLVVHLSTTFFRVKYRQQYQSSNFKLIKENYPDIYIYTQMSIHPFERLIGASLNDYEIGLISTYFASQIANKRMYTSPQVLLVSSGGTGSSRFLMTQLIEQYPYVNFSLSISNSKFQKLKETQGKVIITTVSLSNTKLPFLKVNPILTANDLSNIDDFFKLHGIATTASFQAEYKSIMDIVSDNANILNNAALENGIKQVLLDKRRHKRITERRKQPLLSEVLTPNMIKFAKTEKMNWQQVITLSAQPLLKAGKISDQYIKAIIKNVDDNGPYINIGPEIALAHARPDQGVKELGMSMLLLNRDVDLVDDKHKIRLIIVLAAKDSTSHLKALSELAQILGNKDDVKKIMNAHDSNEIEELIKKGENNEAGSML